jgi:hypothetical protein
VLEVIATLIADGIRYNKDYGLEIERCVKAFEGDQVELRDMIIGIYCHIREEDKMDRDWILRSFGVVFGYDEIESI